LPNQEVTVVLSQYTADKP